MYYGVIEGKKKKKVVCQICHLYCMSDNLFTFFKGENIHKQILDDTRPLISMFK